MRIVFLSPDEPFYLPEFYRQVLEQVGRKHEIKVVIVPPVYKNTTRLGLARKYARTFGYMEAARLTVDVIRYKIMGKFFGSRGNTFYSLASLLDRYGVEHVEVEDLNSPESLKMLKDWGTELLISISCPQIFKRELIDLAPLGCLNMHGSLLPDYRGVMPSFWVLANGEKEAGITIFYVNEKIDAGDVLIQRRYEIKPDDTLNTVIRRSKEIGARMVVDSIKMIENDSVSTTPLDMKKGRYFGWPKREDVQRFIANGRRFR